MEGNKREGFWRSRSRTRGPRPHARTREDGDDVLGTRYHDPEYKISPVRDPLTKVLHRREKINEANESRIGREDRREREEVWWPPEKGFRRRGNFHATNEARRGRERSGGK